MIHVTSVSVDRTLQREKVDGLLLVESSVASSAGTQAYYTITSHFLTHAVACPRRGKGTRQSKPAGAVTRQAAPCVRYDSAACLRLREAARATSRNEVLIDHNITGQQ